MLEFDGEIAIIGVGAMGSMAMWRCALRSRDVVGFDATFPASDSTAVGGDTRLFRRAYQEGAGFTELLADAQQLFHELNSVTAGVFTQCGGLSIGTRGGEYMRSLEASIAASGADHTMLDRDELTNRYPQHALFDDDYGIFDPLAGVIRSDRAVLKAVQLAEQAGAVLIRNTRLTSVASGPGYVDIASDDRRWRFRRVVVTGGAWSAALLPDRLSTHLTPKRLPLTWFVAKEPEQYSPERFPVFIRESHDRVLYGAPSVDNTTVKVAGMTAYGAVHPDQLPRDLNPFELETATRVVAEVLPGLFPSPVRADAYPDQFTLDKVPLIGWIDEMPGVYVATGFSGGGFKMSPAVGEAIAQEVVGRHPVPSLAFARPARVRSVL